MRKCPVLSITSSPPSSSPLSSPHVRMLVSIGKWRAGRLGSGEGCPQEWPGEWDKRKEDLPPPCTKVLVYKYSVEESDKGLV